MTILLQGQKKSSGWGSIGAGLGKGLGEGLEIGEERRQEAKQKKEAQEIREQENEFAAREFGIDLRGINDPKMRQQVVASELAGKRQQEKSGYDAFTRGQQDKAKHEHEREMLNERENLIGQRPLKEPKKTQASQPIDPEQLNLIENVRNDPDFEKASPSKKYQMLTGKGVSRENAKAEADISAEEEKIRVAKEKGEAKKTATQIKQEFDEKLRVHKESEEYDEDVLSKARTAKRTLENVKEAEKALSSKKVTPTSSINILRYFGEPGKALSNAIMNKETKAIQALMPEFLEGKKELFGVRLSDADLRLLQDKSIDIGNSEEANRSVLGLIKKYADQSILRGDIASELSKKHNGYRPLGFERMIDEEVDRQMNPIEMMDSKGNSYSIPAYRVGSAIKKGLSVRNE